MKKLLILLGFIVIFPNWGLAQNTPKTEIPAKVETKSKTKKELPKVIGFTEIQKLKAENFQLKIVQLEKQLEELKKDYIEVLKSVFLAASIPESEWNNYQFDAQRFVFTRIEKKSEDVKK